MCPRLHKKQTVEVSPGPVLTMPHSPPQVQQSHIFLCLAFMQEKSDEIHQGD